MVEISERVQAMGEHWELEVKFQGEIYYFAHEKRHLTDASVIAEALMGENYKVLLVPKRSLLGGKCYGIYTTPEYVKDFT